MLPPQPVIVDDHLLSEPWPADPAPEDGAEAPEPSVARRFYEEHGYVIIQGLPIEDLIEAYIEEWLLNHGPDAPLPSPGGWSYATPYMHHEALRALAVADPIDRMMTELTGDRMGLHLNLTGWRSTQRNWHQDGYLNPDSNRDHYIAAWIALDDIDPDSGPFQYVPGSHKLYQPIRQDRTLAALGESLTHPDPTWPKRSETLLTPFFEREIAERGLTVHTHIAEKGSVLFWHPRLLHRGSAPTNPSLQRRSLICHYSAIDHRPDMPPAVQQEFGFGWYFPIEGRQPA